LQLVVTAELADINLGHTDQTDESDINLLTRLARANGAEATIKQKKLLIFRAGTAQTASGKKLPPITITRADGDQFNYDENDRDHDYTGVVAYYQDDSKARRTGAHVGTTAKEKRLKGTFANAADAQQAANAEKSRIGRSMATFTINKAIGIPEISTESPVILQGIKTAIDTLHWIVTKATHHYDAGGGLNSYLELEASL
jgi:phage protein D